MTPNSRLRVIRGELKEAPAELAELEPEILPGPRTLADVFPELAPRRPLEILPELEPDDST